MNEFHTCAIMAVQNCNTPVICANVKAVCEKNVPKKMCTSGSIHCTNNIKTYAITVVWTQIRKDMHFWQYGSQKLLTLAAKAT
jgi:hypothetical protein